MPRFVIEERIRFKVEADSAQEALDTWLVNGEQAEGYAFLTVEDRHVEDADGNVCEVEE